MEYIPLLLLLLFVLSLHISNRNAIVVLVCVCFLFRSIFDTIHNQRNTHLLLERT